jgi:hypothetical protein
VVDADVRPNAAMLLAATKTMTMRLLLVREKEI